METNRWRNAGKPIRIGKIHVGWYALILIWFVHMSWVTFVGIVCALALLGRSIGMPTRGGKPPMSARRVALVHGGSGVP